VSCLPTPEAIRIRGTDDANPVLLLMQLGPGLPIINDARRFERLLGLEQAFRVVYWDQRGTGLALRQKAPISVELMVDDTVALLEHLHDRFGGKTLVAGFSFGATFATYAAVRRPDLVAGLVAVGLDIDIPLAEQHAYDFALRTARERGNRRAIRQLEAIGPPPHIDAKRFSTRGRWMANFGGVATNLNYQGMIRSYVVSLIRSPDYSLADVVRSIRGVSRAQDALLPDLASTDLVSAVPRLEVPIVFAQGRRDQVAPGEATQRFHDSVIAPSKELVWFDNSAHTPHLEEPDKFRDLLMKVRQSLAGASAPKPPPHLDRTGYPHSVATRRAPEPPDGPPRAGGRWSTRGTPPPR
jgi:pimeloyl-ACP methyl ester carboxylesterase